VDRKINDPSGSSKEIVEPRSVDEVNEFLLDSFLDPSVILAPFFKIERHYKLHRYLVYAL
jgi:hypothetical protein